MTPAAGALVTGGPVAAAGLAVSGAGTARYIFGTRQIAEAMLNPGDRTQLFQLLKLPQTSPHVTRIIGYLSAKYGSQENPTRSEQGANPADKTEK